MNEIESECSSAYLAAMVIAAEELGWIIVVGIAVVFAAELALSAYISAGRTKRPQNADL
jgi:hypothetical protein